MNNFKYTEQQINEIGMFLGEIEVKGRKNHQFIEKIYQILENGEMIKKESGDEDGTI